MKKLAMVGAVALATSLVLAPAALAQESGPESEACKVATAALEDGQARKTKVDKVAEAVAAARAEVAVLVESYGFPEFNVATATAVDVEAAIGVLRDMRYKQHTDENPDGSEPPRVVKPGHEAEYERMSRDMDIVKRLRDTLVEHAAAAEAYLAVDLAKLDADQKAACTEPGEEPEPLKPTPTPTPTPTQPADSDDPYADVEPVDPEPSDDTSQVGEVPVRIDTGRAA